MTPVILLLIKINGILLLFCGAYYAFLRPLTFYTANRWFLLFGIAAAGLLPLAGSSWLQATELPAMVPRLPVTMHAPVPERSGWATEQLVEYLFCAGAAAALVRLGMQLGSLYRLHRRSQQMSYHGIPFRRVPEPVSPFAFLGTIYVGDSGLMGRDLETVLEHEQIHVSGWHTIDVLFAEIGTICCWFNPAAWLLKRAIKENLEFITDRQMVGSGVDPKAYQYSLLRVGTFSPAPAPVNHFGRLTLRKRIVMMNKKRSSGAHHLYYLMVPVVLVLAGMLSVSAAESGDPVRVLLRKALDIGPAAMPAPLPAASKPAITIRRARTPFVMNVVIKSAQQDRPPEEVVVEGHPAVKVDTSSIVSGAAVRTDALRPAELALLRKMEGVEVTSNGSLRINNSGVTRIRINGREVAREDSVVSGGAIRP